MRYLVFITVALFISGCSLKPTPLPQSNDLRLQLVELERQSNRDLGVLKIEKPKGVSYIYSRDFIYSDGEGFYNRYAYHRWAEPLANQLEILMSFSLQKLGIFQAVTTSSSKVSHCYILESSVQNFEHIINDKESKVMVQVEFKLIDTNTRILIDTKSFTIKKKTATKDAKGALNAYNEASVELMNQVASWLLKIF